MPRDKNYLNPAVLAKIGDLELRARYAVEGLLSGMHRSPYSGYSVEFAQHREYVPGDDLRHLDWRVFGKTDRFYIKQFEEETNLQAHLLVDCSASMRYPEDAPADRLTKFEYAATLAACMAYLLVHQQDAVGLMLFDDQVRADLAPQSHYPHLQTILNRLENARLERPTGGKALFSELSGRLKRRSIVMVISDLLAPIDELTTGLQSLRHGGHEVIVAQVLDRDERDFPFQDNTMFEGIEAASLQLLVDPQSLRTGYLAALDAFESRVRATCAGAKMDLVEVSTVDPLDIAIRRYLAARAHWVKALA
jgi:uncharacterized protein (DUF58 family)